MTIRDAGAVAAGGMLLLWPALANGYPLVFSDTATFLDQALLPFMIWDKPWIYGPVLASLSLRLTLWLPALAQGLLVSWVLWRVARAVGAASAVRHLSVCLALAAASTAPWFASLLMPDILAPLTVLLLFVLAVDPTPRSRLALIGLTAFAIASHLSHLAIAAACLAALVVSGSWRAARAPAAALGGAILLLIATNWVGHGRIAISPFGSVFGLARLVADGPARDYLRVNCPEAGYAMCGWVGRFPTDADHFLWDPDGPVWGFPGGPIALAPEASRIVTATILSRPLAVGRAALANATAQLFMIGLDDIVAEDGVEAKIGARLRRWYPPAEQDRFAASMGRGERLRAIAAATAWARNAALLAGSAMCVVLLFRPGRRAPRLFALTIAVLVGLLANAFATGALSGPHDRYQARIAWLVLLPPLLGARRAIGTVTD